MLNSLRDPGAGFMKDTNKVTIVSATGSIFAFDTKSKRAVAADIVNTVVGGL